MYGDSNMKIKHGYRLASPASQYMVYAVANMRDDLHYPLAAFSEFQVGRGRTLNDALSRDPAAPTGLKIVIGTYYTKSQIAEYLAGYGEGFLGAAEEITAALRGARDADREAIDRLKTQVADDRKALRDNFRAQFDERLREFSAGFIEKYARDVTSAANSTCGVYFLKKGSKIVYIGQSVNVYSRVAQHRGVKDFDSVDFLPCARESLDDLEGFFIRLICPGQNGYNPATGNGAPRSSIWGEIVSLPWQASA
jgi:hypothetical protein